MAKHFDRPIPLLLRERYKSKVSTPVQIRRICEYCKKEFTLTIDQIRQVKHKWPVNCSRTCAKKAQHEKNHGKNRVVKSCKICGKEFTTTIWNKDKTYCSSQCSANSRFGIRNSKKTREKIDLILRDEKYLRYITIIAKKFAFKFQLEWQDLLQDYFAALLSGNNTTIEHVGLSKIMTEKRKGITGHRELKDFKFNSIEVLKEVKESHKKMTSIEFREFMIDMLTPLTGIERKFFLLAIKGYTKHEIVNEIRKEFPISNDNFWEMAKKIDYGKWENSYKQDGRVYG